MATKKTTEAAAAPKLSRTATKKALVTHHAAMVKAVHAVLKKNGVTGLTVHSISFAASDGFDDQCDPPCKTGFHCVPVSTGSGVSWQCVQG
jgi:hypothetical protein